MASLATCEAFAKVSETLCVLQGTAHMSWAAQQTSEWQTYDDLSLCIPFFDLIETLLQLRVAAGSQHYASYARTQQHFSG